jgi:hypothetical protein
MRAPIWDKEGAGERASPHIAPKTIVLGEASPMVPGATRDGSGGPVLIRGLTSVVSQLAGGVLPPQLSIPWPPGLTHDRYANTASAR